MRPRHRLLSVITGALVLGLSACQPDTAPTTSVEAAPETAAAAAPTHLEAAERLQRLQAFLQTRYGPAAVLDNAWRAEIDARPVHRYVCLEQAVEIEHVQHSVLAICSNRDDAQADEGGVLDLWLLRADADGGLAVATQAAHTTVGIGGVVGELSLIRLGPQVPAIALQAGVPAMGQDQTDTVLLRISPQRIHEVARFPSVIDNQFHLQCGSSDTAAGTADSVDTLPDDADTSALAQANCDDALLQLRTQWSVDSHDPALGHWPLQLQQRGIACGNAVIDHQVLPFDHAQQRYAPAILMEHCP